MKLLFVYPWDGFRPYFLKKDVGLFPEFLSRAFHGSTTMIVKGRENIATEGAVRIKKTGITNNLANVFAFFAQSLRLARRHSALLVFHIGSRNLLPALAFKLARPRAPIIAKLDLNLRTADYLRELDAGARSLGAYARRLSYRLIFRWCSTILVETTRVADRLPSTFCGVDIRSKLRVVPNGIHPSDLAMRSPECHKRRVITFVTRFDDPDKAADRIAEVVRELHVQEGWTIRIIGSVPATERDRITAAATRNPQFRAQLEFTGHLSDRLSFIRSLDESTIFGNVSKAESFCISMMEAAACGNAVVTTDVGVASDLNMVYPHLTIIEPFSIVDFCRSIERTIVDPPTPSESDLARVSAHYRWDSIVSRLAPALARHSEMEKAACGHIGQ